MPRRRWATPNLLNKPQSIGGGPERRRALAVPDWRSHPLGSACYPKTNQPATASRGTIATATSSKGAGSFPGLYRWVYHRAWSIKPATCFSYLCPDQTQVSGGEAKQSSTSDCIGRKIKCSLNLLPDRNGWAGWQFSVCPQRDIGIDFSGAARPPRRRAFSFVDFTKACCGPVHSRDCRKETVERNGTHLTTFDLHERDAAIHRRGVLGDCLGLSGGHR